MSIRTNAPWLAGATAGILLASSFGAASAVADESDAQGVDLSVEIEDTGTAGELSMSIPSGESVVLTENGSDTEVRQFTATTPTVTVTDTRSPDAIPAGSAWAVVGQAGDFVNSEDATTSIAASHLGWSPKLLSEPAGASGVVAEGQPVEGALDSGPGLVGQELLVSTWESGIDTGTWEVAADLSLRTPADVAPGAYSSTLTLTLIPGS